MLTRDLLRVRVKGNEVVPALVDPDRPALVEDAEALLGTFQDAVEEGWTRGRLDEALGDLVGDRQDHKLLRGLAKVLLDRSDFEVASPVDPVELRGRAFRAAGERGPLASTPGALGRTVARDVLAEVGGAFDLTAEEAARALYADLPEEQRITACRVPDGRWLVHRYNVALVQAILLQATAVHVRLRAPSAPRLRQLFRWVKFQQLLHRAAREGEMLVLTLDGPASVLVSTTRYGLALAGFLPALLLQEEPWTLEAEVLWTKGRHRKRLFLGSGAGLVSHYADTGAYKTRTHTWFEERWAAAEPDWTLDDRTEPLDLGGRDLVLPDYRLTRDGRTAWLEIVGFWRRDWLERRLGLLREHGPGNLVIAVSRRLRVGKEDLAEFPGEVVPFSEVVPVAQVLRAAERVAH